MLLLGLVTNLPLAWLFIKERKDLSPAQVGPTQPDLLFFRYRYQYRKIPPILPKMEGWRIG